MLSGPPGCVRLLPGAQDAGDATGPIRRPLPCWRGRAHPARSLRRSSAHALADLPNFTDVCYSFQ